MDTVNMNMALVCFFFFSWKATWGMNLIFIPLIGVAASFTQNDNHVTDVQGKQITQSGSSTAM